MPWKASWLLRKNSKYATQCWHENNSLHIILLPQQELSKSAKAEVKDAVKFALEGSELPSSELYTDVYTDQDVAGLHIRGCDPFTSNKTQAQA